MTFKVGTILQGGRYVIDSVLGKGGFGLTYRARHTTLGLVVVIKTLQERLQRSPHHERFRSQLLVEAQTLATFQHPSIVRVIDWFEEDQYPCMVMEYIPGVTLTSLSRPDRPLEESYAVYYVRQIATALSMIHAKGFLHRDVKPGNILRRDGNHRAILIDFGIAQTPNPGQRQSRALSANYAPPEQYKSASPLTPAADVYSLAATLYYLLSGTPPISARERGRKRIPSLSSLPIELTPGLEEAIALGMALNREDRPQNIHDWLGLIPRSVPSPVILNETARTAVSETARTAIEISKMTVPTERSPQRSSPQDSRSPAPKSQTTKLKQPHAVALPTPEKRRIISPQPLSNLQLGTFVQRLTHPKTFQESLVTTAILAAIVGGSLALIFRLAFNTHKPLLEINQAFPDKVKWPGGLSTPPATSPETSSPETSSPSETSSPEFSPEPPLPNPSQSEPPAAQL